MKRRTGPKARDQFNEEQTTGRRRQNVHNESTRQRDTNLRARRLQIELAGAATGEVSDPAALASLGPDVLSERVKALCAELQKWPDLPPEGGLRLLQQLVILLSTEVYQAVRAARAGGAVACLIAILQQPDAQLAAGAVRNAALALELIASDSWESAVDVKAAGQVLSVRLAAAVGALTQATAPGGGVAAGEHDGALLEASQLAAPLGAMAGWGADLQTSLTDAGAAAAVLQLLMATINAAADAASPEVAAAAQLVADETPAPEQLAALQPGPEPAAVQCCATALWAVGMLVRGRPDAVHELVSQPAVLAGLRRVLLAPSPYPELLRGVSWVVAFCTSCGRVAPVRAVVDEGGLLPGLLLSAIRFASYAVCLSGDAPDLQSAATPLHRALLPLLLAASNIAASPVHALLVLAELQAARPLPSGASATGMQMLLACLQDRVRHHRVQLNAAALAAGLAAGACGSGPAAVDAARGALAAAGVTSALEELLLRGPADVRKEAGMALALLCEGAAVDSVAGGGTDAEAGNDPRPGRLAMLQSLGVTGRADERGVLEAFLKLVRSASADTVHAGLRFVTVALKELRGARRRVEELDGIDALEAAQEGRNGLLAPALQTWAQELVDEYYGIDCEEAECDEEEEDAELGDG